MTLTPPPRPFVEPNLRPLLSAEEIAERTTQLARSIAADYGTRDVTVIVVLKGSCMFAADLVRKIYEAQVELGLPRATVTLEFLALQSYGDETSTSGVVQITADLTRPIDGKHVLIVEDIVDTGLTMKYLLDNLKTRHPSSVKVCSLLHKPARTQEKVPIDYLGFTIEDLFVVGYGLDYRQRYRNLPFLAVLEP
jgi:hypoxanthine phosphoribosyltransferase